MCSFGVNSVHALCSALPFHNCQWQVIVRGILSSGIVNATMNNGQELLRKRTLEARGASKGVTRGMPKAASTRSSLGAKSRAANGEGVARGAGEAGGAGVQGTGMGSGAGGSGLTRGLSILAKQQRMSAAGTKTAGGVRAGSGVPGAPGGPGSTSTAGAGTGASQGLQAGGVRRPVIAQATSKKSSLGGRTVARASGGGVGKQARVGLAGATTAATRATLGGTSSGSAGSGSGAAAGTTTTSAGATAGSASGGGASEGAGVQEGATSGGGTSSNSGAGTEVSEDTAMEDMGGGVVTDQVAKQRRRLLALDDEAYRLYDFLEDGMAMPPMPGP